MTEINVREEQEETCRLCWGGVDDGPLVQPCACRGSAKLIHEHCLEKWRRTSPKEDAAYRCGQCKDEYRDALSLELLGARLQAERTGGQSTSFTLGVLARALQAHLHPSTLIPINNLGLLQDKGDFVAVEPLYREALGGVARDPRRSAPAYAPLHPQPRRAA